MKVSTLVLLLATIALAFAAEKKSGGDSGASGAAPSGAASGDSSTDPDAFGKITVATDQAEKEVSSSISILGKKNKEIEKEIESIQKDMSKSKTEQATLDQELSAAEQKMQQNAANKEQAQQEIRAAWQKYASARDKVDKKIAELMSEDLQCNWGFLGQAGCNSCLKNALEKVQQGLVQQATATEPVVKLANGQVQQQNNDISGPASKGGQSAPAPLIASKAAGPPTSTPPAGGQQGAQQPIGLLELNVEKKGHKKHQLKKSGAGGSASGSGPAAGGSGPAAGGSSDDGAPIKVDENAIKTGFNNIRGATKTTKGAVETQLHLLDAREKELLGKLAGVQALFSQADKELEAVKAKHSQALSEAQIEAVNEVVPNVNDMIKEKIAPLGQDVQNLIVYHEVSLYNQPWCKVACSKCVSDFVGGLQAEVGKMFAMDFSGAAGSNAAGSSPAPSI